MPAESIEWIDDTGWASLSNGKPTPATRFGNWTPNRVPVGPSKTRLGSGRSDRFEFRRDDLFSFEIAQIPGTATNLELALRLQYHLRNGGLVTLTTTRPLADNFAAFNLAENADAEIDFSDRETLEYTFSVQLNGLTEDEIDADTDLLPPSRLPGLLQWLDIDTLNETKDDEDFVSGLLDQSGNDYHVIETDPFKQPVYESDAGDGYPALQLINTGSGTDSSRLHTTENIHTVVGTTCYLVAKRTTPHVEHGIFLSFTDSVVLDGPFTRIRESHNAPDNVNVQWQVGDDGLGNNPNFGSSTDWFILSLKFTSLSSVTPYYNSLTAGAAFNPADDISAVNGVMIGPINGYFREWLWYDSLHGTTERTSVMRYLAARRRITLV